jgi:hypothetical protein
MSADLNKVVFSTSYVLKTGSPIIYVVHDQDDDWQFLGPESNVKTEDGVILSLGEMFHFDPTLLEIEDMPCGIEAVRRNVGSEWIKSPQSK